MENGSTRPLWIYALIALAGVALYLYSAIEIQPDPIRARPPGSVEDIVALPDRTDMNILFLLIDTLRANRMSAYGYERDTTPFFEKLAQTGIRFDRHTAQSSWTKTSMASLWSGLSALRAGVTKFDHTLSDAIRMPAEILSEAGFKTVGVYRNGWVEGYFGFDQGFEKYYQPMGSVLDPRVQQMRPNASSRGTDENVIADAVEFLRIHGHTSRWFLYLHLMDLHEYTYDAESAIFGNSMADLYDNSLRRTDWVISNLYDHLAVSGLLDKTMLVVLADHGEAFGERGFEGHARSVFPETTETPLIISLPFSLTPGVVVTDRTNNIDVWPTLLDLIGLPDQGEVDGRSRRDEILAAARGELSPSREGEYSIAFLDENWGKPRSKRRAAISVLDGEYRYVAGTNVAGRDFEVLLSSEDGEHANQIEAQPEIGERLRAEAERYLESTAAFDAEIIELDGMQLDQLRALGYQLP